MIPGFLRIFATAFLLQVTITAWSAESSQLSKAVDSSHGLYVCVGDVAGVREALGETKSPSGRIWHFLTADHKAAQQLRKEFADSSEHVIAEALTSRRLPYLDNIANFVIVADSQSIEQGEAERILRPGGTAIFLDKQSKPFVKPDNSETDEWTHQWHGTDGGLTTEQYLGIPTGVQWLAGPLFAMAGRKSSTQTLVTSNGINFYVTQNVTENVGRPVEEMAQFLVARDSYNGIQLWQKPWTGPFVSGNGETNPRMIATPNMLYAVQQADAVIALDPQTGEQVGEVKVDEPIEKIVFQNNMLFLQTASSIRSVDASLQKEHWIFGSKKLSGLTLSKDSAFALSSGRSSDGRFQHDLICLNLSDGTVRYQQNTQPEVTAARVRINFVKDGFVALQAHGYLHMFNEADGMHLWTKATEARPGKTYVDERYVGHFYRRGLVWMLTQNSPREPEGQNLWLALDPRTGEVKKELSTKGEWPRTATPAKMGCQVLIASDRYVLIPRQSTYIDLDTGEKHSFKFTRGGCGLGFVPANGLLYSHPHACGCFSEAIRGFMGMHSNSVAEVSAKEQARRLRTISNTKVTTPGQTSPNEWTMHRASGTRGAFLNVELPKDLTASWSLPVSTSQSHSLDAWQLRTGARVTAATSAAGIAYVAEVNEGRIIAVDGVTGDVRWEFFAAGRIDSPPTIHGETCLFGSHDGCVYSIDRTSGSLNWKYRAAPEDQRIIAFGSIESSWPVAGSVLVKDGVAFVAAGRSPDSDGGIHVIALNAASGEPAWNEVINDDQFWGLSDYLVAGNDSVYLSNRAFAAASGEQTTTDADAAHLKGGKVGLLEASWTRHDLALRKNIQTWTANGAAGQLLAFSPSATASFNAETRRITIDSDEHFEMELPLGEQVTAMAMSRNKLIVAGGIDRSEPMKGGFLKTIDLHSGEVLTRLPLPAESAFDGLSLTKDGVLVALQNGELMAFTAPK